MNGNDIKKVIAAIAEALQQLQEPENVVTESDDQQPEDEYLTVTDFEDTVADTWSIERHNTRWSTLENNICLKAAHGGATTTELAMHFQRTFKSIEIRVSELKNGHRPVK